MGWFTLPNFIFHLFLLLLLHFSSYTCSPLCNHHDNSALLQFKNSFVVNTSDDQPFSFTYQYNDWTLTETFYCSSFSSKTESWKNGTDCCEWDGVKCDAVSGLVIGLDLNCERLRGKFHPNSTIFQLRHLQQLNLAFNYFSISPLYSGIGDLFRLTHLNLSHSGISGDIPSTISHLFKLESLDLSYLAMRLDPSTWKKLIINTTNLREILLNGVNMYSSSMSSLSLLMNYSSSLVSLHLPYTGLQGNLPSGILSLPNLQELDLSSNEDLRGQLPNSNWSTPLRYLNLELTSFSGQIPNSIGHLKYLNHLVLLGCKFNGLIPLSFWNLTQLTGLFLSGNNLQGEIPSLISNLRHLTKLSLGSNNFSGHIPEELGQLLKLKYLRLSTNNLRGLIPSKMVGLSKLQLLDLSDNMLTGTIPHWCYSLPFLSYLDLSNNHLTGPISEFSTYALEYLYLSNNKLQGQLPNTIFEFENLTKLDLSSNDSSVSVDFHQFSKLKSLTFLNLSHINFLSISFDSSVDYELPNLQYLYLSSCNIESSFPKFLAPLQNLEELDLSNNKIHGQIPKWFHDKLLHSWKNIEHIDLNFNQLQGDLPIPPKSIYYFLVSNNHFTGYIDSMICNASSVRVLSLAHNKLTGTIPQCLCNANYLNMLSLANNNLTGTIPQCLGTFRDLVVLDLQMNNLHGSMPVKFSEGNAFETIKLNGNRLEGPLPHALAHCIKLEVLDLGDNNIEDSFPSWLETLQELQVLRLRSNKLRGIITCSNTKHPFPKLRILDVANNNFSGSLPASCFMNFQGMMSVSNNPNRSLYMDDKMYYKDSVVVIMKGQEMELKRILTAFTTIDLSNNMFQGNIPEVLGWLKSLKGLNLSHNGITGTIPHSLSNLRNLEWLDLSWNQLTSDIPMALTNLNFLSVLNLSQNQLEGVIPTGGQFNTFGYYSYEGNPMLCGIPLSKSCNKDDEQPPHSTFEDDEESGFGWKSVVVGYACGALFGMLLGYNLFLTEKPKWLATLVEGVFGIRVKRTNNRTRGNCRGMN